MGEGQTESPAATGQPRLEGKVAFVTGGTKKIGRAVARAFVEAGAHGVITARTESDLRETKAYLEALGGGRVLTVVADATVDEEIVECVRAGADTFRARALLGQHA